jgi:hypothetical protein
MVIVLPFSFPSLPPANADCADVAANVTPTTNVAAVKTATIARVLALVLYYSLHALQCCLYI